MAERLHKLLAQHGFGSRREIEKWMLAGRVLLNNQPAQPGSRFANGDRVVVDGQDVTAKLYIETGANVIAYHKPQGQPVIPFAQSPEGVPSEESVMESLPAVRGSRWLAINTMQTGDSGLLLLTSDGKLADALRRRSNTIPAAYVARVLVPTPEFDVQSLPRAVRYDDETIEFDSIEPIGGEGTNRWFRIPARRAHRRAAVRALFESAGLKVSRIIQVQFADIQLPRDLPRGKHRALTASQVDQLYKFAELTPPAEPTQAREGGNRRFKPAAARSMGTARKPLGANRSGSNRPSRPAGKPASR